MVLNTSLLNTQNYKVRIKWNNSEKRVVPFEISDRRKKKEKSENLTGTFWKFVKRTKNKAFDALIPVSFPLAEALLNLFFWDAVKLLYLSQVQLGLREMTATIRICTLLTVHSFYDNNRSTVIASMRMYAWKWDN